MKVQSHLLCLAFFFLSISITSSATASDREVTIWEVAVAPFQGDVKGVPGQRLATGLARQFQDTRRFKVRSPDKVIAAFKKLQLDPRTTLSREDAARLAAHLDVDGVFTGTFAAKDEALQLDLILRTRSGTPYLTTSTKLTRPITPEALRTASAQIFKALPWDAVVVRVDGHHGLINAGEAQGLKLSQRLTLFEFDGVKDKKDSYEVGDPRGLTEVSIIRLSKQASWVLRLRGDELKAMRKVSIEDVDLAAGTPGTAARKNRKTNSNRLEVASSLDVLIRDYALRSDPFDVRSTSTTFAAPRIAVRWVPLSFGFADVLLRADYRHGFMPYRHTDETTGNVETFAGSLDQATAEAGLSKTLGGTGRLAGTAFHLVAGYRLHRFAIDEQTPLVLTSDTYQQVTVGAGAAVPVFELLRQRRWRFFVFTGVRYAPLVTLTQDPVDLGDGSLFALQGEAGVRTRIVKNLHLSVGWTFDYLSGEFTDPSGGSRGFVNARSTDVYQGLILRADYVLFR